jgi:hypothetical protein
MSRRSPRRKAAVVTDREVHLCKAHLSKGSNLQYISPSKSSIDWPKPPSNLKLTLPEREIWYEGDTITFRALEELVEKRKACRIPSYDELVEKIIEVQCNSCKELLTIRSTVGALDVTPIAPGDNYFPDPRSNLNLALSEVEIWYEGNTITFTSLGGKESSSSYNII